MTVALVAIIGLAFMPADAFADVTYTITVVDDTAGNDPVEGLEMISIDVNVDGFGAQERDLVEVAAGVYEFEFAPVGWDINDVISWIVLIGDDNISAVDPTTIDPTPQQQGLNNTMTITVDDDRP